MLPDPQGLLSVREETLLFSLGKNTTSIVDPAGHAGALNSATSG
jgi:hypothetical protein